MLNKKETQARIDAITDKIIELTEELKVCPDEEKEYREQEISELESAKDNIISDYWDSMKDDTEELREFSNHIFNHHRR